MPARILLDELLSEEESDQAVNDTEPSVTPASKPGQGAPSREQELLDEVASRDAREYGYMRCLITINNSVQIFFPIDRHPYISHRHDTKDTHTIFIQIHDTNHPPPVRVTESTDNKCDHQNPSTHTATLVIRSTNTCDCIQKKHH